VIASILILKTYDQLLRTAGRYALGVGGHAGEDVLQGISPYAPAPWRYPAAVRGDAHLIRCGPRHGVSSCAATSSTYDHGLSVTSGQCVTSKGRISPSARGHLRAITRMIGQTMIHAAWGCVHRVRRCAVILMPSLPRPCLSSEGCLRGHHDDHWGCHPHRRGGHEDW
jgi:hypothetical protein